MHILRYLELLVERGRHLDCVKALHLENGFTHAALGVAAGKVLGRYFFVQIVALGAAEREADIKAFKLECFGHVQDKVGTLVYLKIRIWAIVKNKQAINSITHSTCQNHAYSAPS